MKENIVEKLNWRYATKVFDKSKKISEEDFNILLESLRLSPSSFGLQLWKFILVEDEKVRESLVEHSWSQTQVVDADKLVVICVPDKITEQLVDNYIMDISKTRGVSVEELSGFKDVMMGFTAQMSDADQKSWMKRQAYIALGNLMNTAALLDIDSCPIEGFVPDQYDKLLKLSDRGLESTVVCALGYRDSSDEYAQKRKVRYSLDELIVKI